MFRRNWQFLNRPSGSGTGIPGASFQLFKACEFVQFILLVWVFGVNWIGMLDAGLCSGFEIDGALVQMIFELIFAFGISLETNENEIRKNI